MSRVPEVSWPELGTTRQWQDKPALRTIKGRRFLTPCRLGQQQDSRRPRTLRPLRQAAPAPTETYFTVFMGETRCPWGHRGLQQPGLCVPRRHEGPQPPPQPEPGKASRCLDITSTSTDVAQGCICCHLKICRCKLNYYLLPGAGSSPQLRGVSLRVCYQPGSTS